MTTDKDYTAKTPVASTGPASTGTDGSEAFRLPKKPSMKRRMETRDYTQRSIYMVTMATEGRRPLLGALAGRADAPAGSSDAPRVVLTELGRRVEEAAGLIPRFYPVVKVLAMQVMPDHVHMLLFVQERMEVPLGRVVNGFKVGCNRAYRQWLDGGLSGGLSGGSPQCGEQQDRGPADRRAADIGAARDRSHGFLFETGYHDRILSGRGQLQRMIDYIRDNPRRLLLKRTHAAFFQRTSLQVAGRQLHAFGNLALLRCLRRIPVKCSRSWSAQVIAQYVEDCLSAAQAGAVLVSPFISPGEKAVRQAALEAVHPLIILSDNGFPEYYKPAGLLFEACAAGRLLLLTPYEYHTGQQTISRAVCTELNTLAVALSMS